MTPRSGRGFTSRERLRGDRLAHQIASVSRNSGEEQAAARSTLDRVGIWNAYDLGLRLASRRGIRPYGNTSPTTETGSPTLPRGRPLVADIRRSAGSLLDARSGRSWSCEHGEWHSDTSCHRRRRCRYVDHRGDVCVRGAARPRLELNYHAVDVDGLWLLEIRPRRHGSILIISRGMGAARRSDHGPRCLLSQLAGPPGYDRTQRVAVNLGARITALPH